MQQLIQLPGGNWFHVAQVAGIRVERESREQVGERGWIVLVDLYRYRSFFVRRYPLDALGQAEAFRDELARVVNQAIGDSASPAQPLLAALRAEGSVAECPACDGTCGDGGCDNGGCDGNEPEIVG